MATDPAASPSNATKPPLEALHDAAQQAGNLRSVLQDDKQRIGCFLGAGCPLGIYDEAGVKSVVLIPAVVDLTKEVAEGLQAADNVERATSEFKKSWDSLKTECKSDGGAEPTVEDILTELRALANLRGTADVRGMSKKVLNDLDSKICALITARMKMTLPDYRCSYNRFASWVGGVHRASPVEIFTPNYDLLFERTPSGNPMVDGSGQPGVGYFAILAA